MCGRQRRFLLALTAPVHCDVAVLYRVRHSPPLKRPNLLVSFFSLVTPMQTSTIAVCANVNGAPLSELLSEPQLVQTSNETADQQAGAMEVSYV